MKKLSPLIIFLIIVGIIVGILIIPTKTSKESMLEPVSNEPAETNITLSGPGLLEFRGIDFAPTPNGYNTKFAYEALESLLDIPEINYIELRFFLTQDYLSSTDVKIVEGQERILTFLIQRIHKRGKKVSLMPQLRINDKSYEAKLKPQEKLLWFKNYSDAILQFAQIAEQNEVELFSIGNELTSMFTDVTNINYWNKLVDSVKEIYHGKMTVKINCWYRYNQFQDLLQIEFFHKLDYLGIAAYFDLTNKMNPTEIELRNAWFNNRQELNLVKEIRILSETYQKPIIFSEIGYRNVDGSNIEPWNADAKPPRWPPGLGTGIKDDAESVLCTKVLFETFLQYDWFQGTFWFCWPTGILSENDMSYSIRNKSILKELLKYYRKERN